MSDSLVKTPKEIKKGLECCKLHDDYDDADCSQCPYTRTTGKCVFVMHDDALAYIKQLETELDNTRLAFAQQTREVEEYKVDLLNQVKKVIEQLPRWISMDERPPDDGQSVIVHVKHTEKWGGDWHAVMEDCWYGGGWDVNADTDIHKVTHWRPMPEPPEGENGGAENEVKKV